jgi:hypothetical protein
LPSAKRRERLVKRTVSVLVKIQRQHLLLIQALLAAERHAPEEVDRPSVRDLVSGLLYAPTVIPDGLRGLADRIGAVRMSEMRSVFATEPGSPDKPTRTGLSWLPGSL